MIFWRKLYYKIIFKYIDEKHNLRKCAIFGIFIFLIIHFNEVMRNVLLQKIKSIDFEWTLVYNIFVCF